MTGRRIRKVLIANRGEIAVRVLRTCKEMGIATVAVYSDSDRSMPHVHMADEAYHIGPSPSRESYLVVNKILDVARRSGADAIHPGYGFLSENAEFARQVGAAGLIFIGPSPESIKAMGDKTEARKLVGLANVPTVPGTGTIASGKEAEEFCVRYGFPVLIKAAAGGGGKGMRVVAAKKDLAAAFQSAKSEARSAFGDDRVYIEKYLEEPRHIEFQILADSHGTTVHLGERECSIQRRHQKVIEESPSVILDDSLRRTMGDTAVNAARACKYHNAGTIEFLVDKNRNYYFLEMNTRLQVEHPITELRTGIDIVAQQLRVAMGETLGFTQDEIQFRGHAIECRICAEDSGNNFMPSIGTIMHLKSSQGFGIREDRGVEQGGQISVYYDPMISKLVAWGATREEAIRRMVRALEEYELLGVKTNIRLCLFILQHPKFLSGNFDTHFIPDYFKPEHLRAASELEYAAASVVCAMLGSETGMNESKSSNALPRWKEQRLHNLR